MHEICSRPASRWAPSGSGGPRPGKLIIPVWVTSVCLLSVSGSSAYRAARKEEVATEKSRSEAMTMQRGQIEDKRRPLSIPNPFKGEPARRAPLIKEPEYQTLVQYLKTCPYFPADYRSKPSLFPGNKDAGTRCDSLCSNSDGGYAFDDVAETVDLASRA